MNTQNAIKRIISGFPGRRSGRRSERGSLAVETAIFLPFFLIAVLTVGWIIRMEGISENVYHSLADETGALAAEAKLPALSPFFAGDLKDRISSENRGEISDIKIAPIAYRVPWADPYTGRVHTNLIGLSVNYRMPILIPHSIVKGVAGSSSFLCRAFVGKDNTGEVFSFDRMEQDDSSALVWVFPRAGERYHGENCSVIKNNPREMILCSSIRYRYQPCALCKPGSQLDGALVYVFPKTGGVYHLGSCYIVDRYVIQMSEDDARREGYTPCLVCGGK